MSTKMIALASAVLLGGIVSSGLAQVSQGVADTEIDFFPAATPGNPNPPPQIHSRRVAFNATYLPLTAFSVSGAIGNGGGTQTTYGQILALDAAQRLSRGQRFEVGAWYFLSNDQHDLYQISARYFLRPEWGLQVAYLNSNHGDASSMTAFAIYDLALQRLNPKAPPLRFQIGVGAYFNFASQIDPTFNGQNVDFPLVPRESASFTYFVNGSYNLKHRLSINAGAWYVHDRNVEFNRFTLGIGYQF